MIRSLTYVALVAIAAPVMASETPPSGLRVELHETIYEPQGVTSATAKTMRLRFLAPEIVDKSRYDIGALDSDFLWLCESVGLVSAAKSAPMVEQIIVSIASEIVTFGETAPNVVQYFDAFRLEGESCIWEGL